MRLKSTTNTQHQMKSYYTTADLKADVERIVASGKRAFVTRHIVGRIGPVLEVKPLGFGTRDAMLRVGNSWLTVDPMMCETSAT